MTATADQQKTASAQREQAAADTGGRRYHSVVAGECRAADEVIERFAPGTGELVARVGKSGAAEVNAAVAAARTAFDSGPWPRSTGFERAAVLNSVADLIDSHADRLARLDAEEGGKPLRLAKGDIAGAAALTRYAAGLAMQAHGSTVTNNGPDFTGLVLREPVGVAALIIPWNFPALILCQKLPFALGAGCTVVVKPSELTTGSALEIARFYGEAGLPPGAVNVVTGDGRPGQLLAEHAGVDAISFTGSTATGRTVADAARGNLKRVSLELGGKAASVVFADADIADAVDGVLFGAYFNSGECCVSQSRLLVQDAIADEFVAALRERVAQLKVGQPLDQSTDVGPMIHDGHLAKVLGSVDRGRQDGARLAAGGCRVTARDLAAGLFVQPTILDGVRPEMSVFTEEIFGPVLTVSRFCTPDDAVALANAVPYGLSNSIWSKNVDTVLDVAKALRSGTVYVNTAIDAPPSMPFGGYKASGYGREMGQAGFDEYTELKSVNIRTGPRRGSFAITGAP